jgi:hypothetical protein
MPASMIYVCRTSAGEHSSNRFTLFVVDVTYGGTRCLTLEI